MKKSEVLQAWATILSGRAPSLSIEITKECPLRCPGCYAFDAAHLGSDTLAPPALRLQGTTSSSPASSPFVDERKPLHVSLVGGDPLRPLSRARAAAFPRSKPAASTPRSSPAPSASCPPSGARLQKTKRRRLHRRPPARARRAPQACHLRAHPQEHPRAPSVTIHSTITSQIASNAPAISKSSSPSGAANPAIAQRSGSASSLPSAGATDPRDPHPRATRSSSLNELRRLLPPLYPCSTCRTSSSTKLPLRPKAPKSVSLLEPPKPSPPISKRRSRPASSVATRTVRNAADIASMGLAAVGHFRVAGPLTAGNIFLASERFGKLWKRLKDATAPPPKLDQGLSHFQILNQPSTQPLANTTKE